MFKPNNVIQAIRDRQYGGRQEMIEPILRRTAENVMMNKAYLKDFSTYKFNLKRDVRTTFLTVFSPDGKRVACAHGDRTISIISMKTKQVERVLSGGHIRSLWTLSWAPFTVGSDYIIASGCLGGHVHLWFNDDRSSISYNFNKPIASLSFHPVIPMLAIAVDNTLAFWDIRDGEAPQTLLHFEEDETKIRYVSYDNKGKYLVTGIKKWDYDDIEHFQDSRTYMIEVWTLPDEGFMTSLDSKDTLMIVEKSSLHNDSTVAIDKHFTKLATTVSHFDGDLVNVYSLEPNNFGDMLLRIPNIYGVIVSLSFSPSLGHLIIGHNMSESSVMSIVRICKSRFADHYLVPEIILHRLPKREIGNMKTLTGAINECIQDYIEEYVNVICICSNKRRPLIRERSRSELCCNWFLNYIREIDKCLSCFDDLTVHDVKFKFMIREMKHKYKLCHELTHDVLSEMINFCMEVQKLLTHNIELYKNDLSIKLNCLNCSTDVDNGILASFNNGNVIMIK